MALSGALQTAHLTRGEKACQPAPRREIRVIFQLVAQHDVPAGDARADGVDKVQADRAGDEFHFRHGNRSKPIDWLQMF